MAESGAPLAVRRVLGWTELEVSPVALGTMQFGWTLSSVGSMDLLDAYVEAGGNFIDTADMYGPDQTRRSWDAARPHVGVSEDVIGRWMRDRRNRDELVIATKVRAQMWDGEDGLGLSRTHIVKAAEDSLRRLQIDTIDLYQAHWPDDQVPLEETLSAFGALVDAGKVRYIGTSNFDTPKIAKLLELSSSKGYPRIASEQPRFNLVNLSAYEASLRQVALEESIGVICYSPLASGFLTGKHRREGVRPLGPRLEFVSQYFTDAGWALVEALHEVAVSHDVSPTAVALAWVLGRPGITAVIVGANSIEQLSASLPAARLELSEDESERLSRLGWESSQIEFSSW